MSRGGVDGAHHRQAERRKGPGVGRGGAQLSTEG